MKLVSNLRQSLINIDLGSGIKLLAQRQIQVIDND